MRGVTWVLVAVGMTTVTLGRSNAQSEEAPGQPIITLASARTLTAGDAIKEVPPGDSAYYIAYAGAKPITAEALERLSAFPIEGYIYPNSYVMRLNDADWRRLQELGLIRHAWLYNSSGIIDPQLAMPAESIAAVHLFESADVRSVLARLGEWHIPINGVAGTSLIVHAYREELQQIAEIPGVRYIGVPESFEIINDDTAVFLHVDRVRERYGLYGDGQIVAIADTGFDIGEISDQMHHDYWTLVDGQFFTRVLEVVDYVPPDLGISTSPDDLQGHGTHVSGTVLGWGLLSGSDPEINLYDGSFAGMAPRASLMFGAFGFDDPYSNYLYISGSGELYDSFYMKTNFYNRGARVMSNSWGCSLGPCPSSAYKLSSQTTDRYIGENRDFVIVFAAGNYGLYNSVRPPGNAKNTLSIGAAVDDITVATFSCRGPTDDGRVKPDLVAPGISLVSTLSQLAHSSCDAVYPENPNYSYCTGTSMATPATAGVATLVREYYIRYQNHFPSAALVKATLINGAWDMGYGIPSYEAGWGFVDVLESLPSDGKELVFLDRRKLLAGEQREIRQSVGSGGPLKVTLVWTDFPGELESERTLVSDLDLEVVDPHGHRYAGTGGGSAFVRTGGQTVPGPVGVPQYDRINNVERIIMERPLAGEYTIRVSAFNTPMGKQDFALVVTFATGP
ncbi:MAG: S8 family serine peptidase [Planctomycetota bacterium]